MTLVVTTFYKFVQLSDCATIQQRLLEYCTTQAITGTILLAKEGINGTIAGSRSSIDAVLSWLRSDTRLVDLEYQESFIEKLPFERLKVKLKKEIVTLGKPEIDPTQQVGIHVPPQEWNRLIRDPQVLVIDTRNDYEVSIGSFENAHNPQTSSFRQFPEYVRRHLKQKNYQKVAMFCTGGIRCEKASSLLLKEGFEQVYQLKGGILRYLAEIPAKESLWRGECFVFDQRVAVKHGLEMGTHELCYNCGHPISVADRQSEQYQPGVSCPHCV